ncbi:hypothetical protein ACIRBY_03565 [Streptomyces sp. NPDC096136]|uniref:hypothetical protein n=1 Tax=Streptomyces sp. NPDC096136 TaxID=3366076 RepID=UPI003807542A
MSVPVAVCGEAVPRGHGLLTGRHKKDLIARTPSPAHAEVLLTSSTEQGRTVLDRAYQEVVVPEWTTPLRRPAADVDRAAAAG